MSVAQLRHELAEKYSVQFLSENEVSPPEGLPTGINSIDNYLLWGGLPKGDLSLLHGKPGTGATSVALSAIREAQKKRKMGSVDQFRLGTCPFTPDEKENRSTETFGCEEARTG